MTEELRKPASQRNSVSRTSAEPPDEDAPSQSQPGRIQTPAGPPSLPDIPGFNGEVVLDADEHCEWRKHFRTGTCVYQVALVLENQARRNPQRFVFAHIPTIVNQVNTNNAKKFRKKAGRKFADYSQSAVEQVLKAFRDVGLLSQLRREHVKTNKGWQWQSGWTFVPHDLVTESGLFDDQKLCFFIDQNLRLISGGTVEHVSRDPGASVVSLRSNSGASPVSVGSHCGVDHSEVPVESDIYKDRSVAQEVQLSSEVAVGSEVAVTTTTPTGSKAVSSSSLPSLSTTSTKHQQPIVEKTVPTAEHVSGPVTELPDWFCRDWNATHGPNSFHHSPKHAARFTELLSSVPPTIQHKHLWRAYLRMAWITFARLDDPPYQTDSNEPNYTIYPIKLFLDTPKNWLPTELPSRDGQQWFETWKRNSNVRRDDETANEILRMLKELDREAGSQQ
jgi:hypothetical protein